MHFENDLKIVENTPYLETERLILRRFVPEDAEALFEILRNEEVNTFLPWFPAKTVEDACQWMKERYLDSYSDPWGYNYAVCLKETGELIGYAGASYSEKAEFGYGYRKDCWRKGYGTEAGKAILERMRDAGFPFVIATHDRENPGSGGVMRKCGMTYRYSYNEQWQPKDIPVVFRMYQIDFKSCETFDLYKEMYSWFVEDLSR